MESAPARESVNVRPADFLASCRFGREFGGERSEKMKWVTRTQVKVDRVACPWLIKKFVDPDAEFLFVPDASVLHVAENMKAIPFDVPGVELGHHGKQCSFDAIVKKFHLTNNPALLLLARIVNGADTDNSLWKQPEGPGLAAIAEGLRHLGIQDDQQLKAAAWLVFDALYAYCQIMVERGKLWGAFEAS
jgi:hypothetical protein